MLVPEGISVTMWEAPDFNGMSFGNYTGPISIPDIDGSSDKMSVSSVKIVKVNELEQILRKRTNQRINE